MNSIHSPYVTIILTIVVAVRLTLKYNLNNLFVVPLLFFVFYKHLVLFAILQNNFFKFTLDRYEFSFIKKKTFH